MVSPILNIFAVCMLTLTHCHIGYVWSAQTELLQDGFNQVGAIGEESICAEVEQSMHGGLVVDSPVVDIHSQAVRTVDNAPILEGDAMTPEWNLKRVGVAAVEPR